MNKSLDSFDSSLQNGFENNELLDILRLVHPRNSGCQPSQSYIHSLFKLFINIRIKVISTNLDADYIYKRVKFSAKSIESKKDTEFHILIILKEIDSKWGIWLMLNIN